MLLIAIACSQHLHALLTVEAQTHEPAHFLITVVTCTGTSCNVACRLHRKLHITGFMEPCISPHPGRHACQVSCPKLSSKVCTSRKKTDICCRLEAPCSNVNGLVYHP